MSLNRKDFLKPKSKAKSKAQAEPQSENDFLEAADQFEESAGKWKAGDAVKGLRFFNRAIDTYNQGLQRYPKSFDLAYNKANLEYKMIQDDRIAIMLGNKLNLLEEALQSHRVAIALDQENTDVLFNTAQVLTSLAELLIEGGLVGQDMGSRRHAIEFLEEAAAIFSKCLARQHQEYERIQAETSGTAVSQDAEQLGSAPASFTLEGTTETAPDSAEAPEEWVTVVEPLTPESLLETCTAQLAALTNLIGLYDPYNFSPESSHIFLDGVKTVDERIPLFIKYMQASPSVQQPEEPKPGPTLSVSPVGGQEEETSINCDALIAAANFRSSLAESKYRSKQLTAPQYANIIEELFKPLVSPITDGQPSNLDEINILSAYADALFDFSCALSNMHSQEQTSNDPPAEDLNAQWTALSQVQTIFTKLSTGANTSRLSPSKLADIFTARGDTDLCRFRLALYGTAKPAWIKSKSALLSNAGAFYRAAKTYAERAGKHESQKSAEAKAIIAQILKEATSDQQVVGYGNWKEKREDIIKALQSMVAEEILGANLAEDVLGRL